MNEFARTLRKNQTDAERKIWQGLRNRALGGFKFRRQHRIGRYIVDFVCIDARLVVELDGGQHLDDSARDAARTAFLAAQGYRVIRFWDDDALLRTAVVLEEILRHLATPHPNPLPISGERE